MAYVDALIVGLGNPGTRYAKTRHNIGWMAVDALLAEHGATPKAKHHGRYAEIRLGEIPVAVLAPETFMNDSGRSVGACVRDLRLPVDEVVVVYDDIELAPGVVRAREGGGLKGHNGLRSLADALGSPDFVRVRCGVGRPGKGDPRDVAAYVLSAFEAHEDPAALAREAARCAEAVIVEGIDAALSRWP
ncbi:MAG: aminoacyl-tRNA hydrolase [Gaiellales bacterium]